MLQLANRFWASLSLEPLVIAGAAVGGAFGAFMTPDVQYRRFAGDEPHEDPYEHTTTVADRALVSFQSAGMGAFLLPAAVYSAPITVPLACVGVAGHYARRLVP